MTSPKADEGLFKPYIVSETEVSSLIFEENSEMRSIASKTVPSIFVVHLTLIFTQIIFGGGQVVGKLGLPAANPVLFALIRELIAGPVLVALAIYFEGIPEIERKHVLSYSLCGVSLFINQFCNIVGVKLSNAILSSAWQPAQPIFVIIMALALGWEKATPAKLAGILISFGGALFLTFFHQDLSGSRNLLFGNLMFFLNDIGAALYVIFSKSLLRSQQPMTVTGLSYIIASGMMLIAALVVNCTPVFLHFVCSDCNGYAWAVPSETIWALAYWIVFNSIISYLLITWANKYADASKVMAYSALQPASAMILSFLIVKLGWYSLALPGWNALGLIGILAGIALIIYDTISEKQEYNPLNIEDISINLDEE